MIHAKLAWACLVLTWILLLYRELEIRCKKALNRKELVKCMWSYPLEKWMKEYKGVMHESRVKLWGSILYPNYYVRMLNGIGDAPHTVLTRSHLEKAKKVLDSFDTVLVLEDGDEANLAKLHELFGNEVSLVQNAKWAAKIAVKIPKTSNNKLKKDSEYTKLRVKMDRMKPLFDKMNQLDLELYEYATSEKSMNRRKKIAN